MPASLCGCPSKFFGIFVEDDPEVYPAQADDLEAARCAARTMLEDGHTAVEIYPPGKCPECGYKLYRVDRDEHGNIVFHGGDHVRRWKSYRTPIK